MRVVIVDFVASLFIPSSAQSDASRDVEAVEAKIAGVLVRTRGADPTH